MIFHAIIGAGNQLAYQLTRHLLLGWSLFRWINWGLFFAGATLAFRVFRWQWTTMIVIGVWLGLLLLGNAWLKRRQFIHFVPISHPQTLPEPQPLIFPEKIPVLGSGHFAVDEKDRTFLVESAFYQTFHTRERVVMVQIPRSRLLALALSPGIDEGWWYLFFKPEYVQRVEIGHLWVGRHPRETIAITFVPEGEKSAETCYLSTDTLETQQLILADLLADPAIPNPKV